MRIAHFIEDYASYGGTQRVASNLSQIMKESGEFVPIIFSFKSSLNGSFYNYGSDTKFIILNKNSQDLTVEINRICNEHKIDIVIFHGYHLLFFIKGFRDIHLFNFRIILRTAFSSQNFLKINPIYPIWKNIFRNSVKYINFQFNDKRKYKKRLTEILRLGNIVCVSKKCQEELKELFNNDLELKEKIHYIYNPIAHLTNDNASYCKTNTIVYASRLRKSKKNSMLIVRAWKVISNDFPNWQLVILGDGELEVEMKNYVKKHALSNVHFHGVVNNVSKFYKESKIAVLSSNSDALPQSLVEAAYYSNALLSTAFDGGLNEIIENGYNGYIVTKNNFSEFAIKLRILMTDEFLVRDMAKKSRILSQKFNTLSILNQWQKLLYHEATRNTH